LELALSPTENLARLVALGAPADAIVFFNPDGTVAYPQALPKQPSDCRDIKAPNLFTRTDADPLIARPDNWAPRIVRSIVSLSESDYYVYSSYSNGSFQLV